MTIQLTLQYGGKYIHSVDRRGQKQRILMCKKNLSLQHEDNMAGLSTYMNYP